MNSVFALMIVSVSGVVEAPNNFATMAECQKVVESIQFQSYCIEKKPVDTENEMKKFVAIFKMFQKELEK